MTLKEGTPMQLQSCHARVGMGLLALLFAVPAMAVLKDRGPVKVAPGQPDDGFPAWYRDNGIPATATTAAVPPQALEQCVAQTPSPNPAAGGAPMCFPLAPGEAFGLFELADAVPTAGAPVEAGRRPDGAASLGGRVWGSYLHGVFDLPDFRRAWLASLGAAASGPGLSLEAARDAALDRLADAFEASVDLDQLSSIIGIA